MSNSQSRRARIGVASAVRILFSVMVVLVLLKTKGEPANAVASASPMAIGEATEVYELPDGDFVEVRVLFDSSRTTSRQALMNLNLGLPVAGEGQVSAQNKVFLQWPADKLPVPVAYYAGNDRDNPSARGPMQWAMGLWNAVPYSTFRFADGGVTQTEAICDETSDNKNTVGYSYSLPALTLGVTCSLITPKNAEGLMRGTEFDMVLNGLTSWSVADVTPAGKIDLNSVMLHELGHALGLDHSDVAGAVMLPSISAGQKRTTLTPDDVAAVQSLYTRHRLPVWGFCRATPTCSGGPEPVIVGANAYLAFTIEPPPSVPVTFEASWNHARRAKDALSPSEPGSGRFNLKADALGSFDSPGLLSVQIWVGTKSAGIVTANVLPTDAGPAGLSISITPVSVGGRDRLLATAHVRNVSDRAMSGVAVSFSASGDGCSYSFPHDLTSDASGDATWIVDKEIAPIDTWCTITASAGSYTSVYPVRVPPRDVPLRGAHVIVVSQISRE